MRYIANADAAEGCIFCAFPEDDKDTENLIVHRGKTAFIILNAYPYSNGHLMVSPYQHTSKLDDLADEELLEIMALTRLGVNVLKKAFRPDGFNVGMNMGRVAGAGIADHVHTHIVPRWNGDTNYMTVVGETRVLPEDLSQTAEKLRPIFARLAEPTSEARS